jgi:hypothetical protein
MTEETYQDKAIYLFVCHVIEHTLHQLNTKKLSEEKRQKLTDYLKYNALITHACEVMGADIKEVRKRILSRIKT